MKAFSHRCDSVTLLEACTRIGMSTRVSVRSFSELSILLNYEYRALISGLSQDSDHLILSMICSCDSDKSAVLYATRTLGLICTYVIGSAVIIVVVSILILLRVVRRTVDVSSGTDVVVIGG